jgi:thiol-disulfide isomerase/thioredoxin
VLGAAPDFTGTQQWFNTATGRALTIGGLRGRVVLVDFWTYTCINCLRTLPYLEAWDRRYRAAGLSVVGVHSPEFGFEKDAGNVKRAIAANGIRYAVAQDNDLATWNAWGNRYWPSEYLIDTRGRVRHAAFGEGDYAATERAIRSLLAERGAEVGAAMANPHSITPVSIRTTPETYVGAERALGWVGTAPRLGIRTYVAATGLNLNAFTLGGGWDIGAEAATARTGATIDAEVRARFVYLVLSPPAGRSGSVKVSLDGGAPRRIAVPTQRLYTLVAGPRNERHRLHLALGEGTAAYAFTFG